MTAELSQPGVLSYADSADIGALLAAAAQVDGGEPVSEDVRLRLRGGTATRGCVVLARTRTRDPGSPEGSSLAGFAHLGPPAPVRQAELLVHPAHRRHGVGGQLLKALLAVVDDQSCGEADGGSADHGGGADHDGGGRRLAVWAHTDSAAAAALARRYGFARDRVLLQLTRDLGSTASPPEAAPLLPEAASVLPEAAPVLPEAAPVLPEAALPPGVRLRPFEPGRDDSAWLDLNRRAFADHPEQGRWAQADLDARAAQPWFDPAGFLLAEASGRLVGFHWTKLHSGSAAGAGRPGPVGEVYILGVDPAHEGGGLGRGLLVAGLRHLSGQGARTAMLYVDEGNVRAVRLYTGMGFGVRSRDVSYAQRAGVTETGAPGGE